MFQVFNDSGVLTIDSNEKGMRFVAKYVVNLTGDMTTVATGILKKCWAAFGNTNGAYISVSHNSSNGQLMIQCPTTSAGKTVTILLFCETDIADDTANYGLQVFSASGALVYSSNHKPLIVMGNVVSDRGLFTSVGIPANAFILSPPEIGLYEVTIQKTASAFLLLMGIDVWCVGDGQLKRSEKIVVQRPVPDLTVMDVRRPNIPILLVDGSKY